MIHLRVKVFSGLMLFAMLFSFFKATGQDEISFDSAKHHMQAIMAAYSKNDLQKLNVYSNLYMSDSPTVKIDSMVGMYYIQGKNIHASLDNSVFLRNEKWSVSVFTDSKEIYVDSIQNENDLNLKGNLFQMIDSSTYDTAISYKVADNGNDTILLKANYDVNSKLIESVLIYKKSTGRLVFTQYKLPLTEENEELTYNKYYILQMLFEEPYIDDSAENIFNENKYFFFDSYRQPPYCSEAFKDFKIITAFNLPRD